MPELLVVHKVNKTTRLTRVYPAPPLIPLLKAKCAFLPTEHECVGLRPDSTSATRMRAV
jgi:hypothetical protein